MITAEDIMFWLAGFATAPATFAGVASDVAAVIKVGEHKDRIRLARLYLRAGKTTGAIGDRSGEVVFRWLAGLLLAANKGERCGDQ